MNSESKLVKIYSHISSLRSKWVKRWTNSLEISWHFKSLGDSRPNGYMFTSGSMENKHVNGFSRVNDYHLLDQDSWIGFPLIVSHPILKLLVKEWCYLNGLFMDYFFPMCSPALPYIDISTDINLCRAYTMPSVHLVLYSFTLFSNHKAENTFDDDHNWYQWRYLPAISSSPFY